MNATSAAIDVPTSSKLRPIDSGPAITFCPRRVQRIPLKRSRSVILSAAIDKGKLDTICVENGTRPDSKKLSKDFAGMNKKPLTTIGLSTNIMWHDCSVDKGQRQTLLDQKGCVIWFTGLSGSGKSTVASTLSQMLHQRGKLCYVLDGDNIRHGLSRDLSFNPEDRAENIRRVAEVAKLFADAGLICIACLISPYKKDREICRALLPEGQFIEVFMDVPLQICEARDAKGLYKLARAGKIKGFTGVDDPYEPPSNSEVVLKFAAGECASPCDMAQQVVSFLEEKGFLYA